MENIIVKTRIQRIEEAIQRNWEKILKGGDRTYYTKQILKLNALLNKTENNK